MTRQLRSGRAGAERGSARHMVVLLHGYGADGSDLIGLAGALGPHLPNTVFTAPDAPEPCRGNPGGRQWFAIPWMDGASEATAEAGLLASAADLDAWLGATLEAEGLTPADTILAGFSQGAMMALHLGVRRAPAVAGICAIAGRLLAPERLEAEAVVKPPVMLIHGDQDPVVPFASLSLAANALKAGGFDVARHVMRGTGHGIAPDGLGAAIGFIDRALAAAAAP